MKGKRHSESQIIAKLRQAEAERANGATVGVWALNGSGQRLFARGERYDREAHVAAVRGLRAPALIAHKAWTNVKVLFR